jgi:hypothetical protein
VLNPSGTFLHGSNSVQEPSRIRTKMVAQATEKFSGEWRRAETDRARQHSGMYRNGDD